MPSSRPKPNVRRRIFLKLAHQIEGQLREAYAKKFADGQINQTILAEKLDVDRSAINRRLSGRTNMTIKTIADMVWALDHDIDVKIFDCCHTYSNILPLAQVQKPLAPAIPNNSLPEAPAYSPASHSVTFPSSSDSVRLVSTL